MTVRTERAENRYAQGEGFYLLRSTKHFGGQRRRGVVWLHGAGCDHTAALPSRGPSENRLMRAVVEAGYVVIHPDAGGRDTWGNDLAMARISAAVGFLGRQDVDTDRIALVGSSMGHANAANWARRNLDRVAVAVGIIPVCDIDYQYRNGMQQRIDGAYANGWSANSAERNPVRFAHELQGVPYRLYFTRDDNVVPVSAMQEFAEKVGPSARLVEVGPGGHTDRAYATIPPGDLVAALDSGHWADSVAAAS